VRKFGHRSPRTIARSTAVEGIGFLTGANVRLCFQPAPPGTGIVFIRTDLRPCVQIPARYDQVTSTQRRTTLGQTPAQVGLVEHVLAALAGLRIDNCFVELNAPEPPGLDGSARGFVEALLDAGSVLQPGQRGIWGVEEAVVVRSGGATLTLHPGPVDELRASYLLNYGHSSPIDRQSHTQSVTPESFINELGCCRTFILESETAALRSQGLGARTTTADLLVFGRHGPINNCLRFANEPARHKVLDMVGDLALLGQDLCGHLVAYRSGHPLNVELVRTLSRGLTNGQPATVRQAA
jgi:UDP-3-O-acyl N-acetylglucosamine deacetylase